jgi:hypothetical protein
MSERNVPGEQGLDGRRAERQAAEIGSEANTAQEEAEYLLFTNSSRSYFQFQMKDTDSSK